MSKFPEADAALTKAKIAIMSRSDMAFFSCVCFSLRHSWNVNIPTARASTLTIEYNPTFFIELSEPEREFLLLHETMHVALLHTLRLESRDPLRWNHAADYVINDCLIQAGMTMPEGGLHDAQYRNMSTEEVFNLIPAQTEDPGAFGSDISQGDSEEEGATDKTVEKEQLDNILIRAKTSSEMAHAANNIPGITCGEIEIYLANLLAPKLPWFRILRKFFTERQKSDYSFRKPNRRYFPTHILPSQDSEAIVDLAIAVDTSGSVTDDEFAHFIAETAGIMRQLKPKKINFIQFDTDIKRMDTLRNMSDLKRVEFSGRGGTNMRPVMDWAKENKPKVLLVFTDGYFSKNYSDPNLPVVWLIHSAPKFVTDFGKIIRYEFND
jgi:predicted metal-dependent peptidase